LAIRRLAALVSVFLAQAAIFSPSSPAADSQSARSDSVSRIMAIADLRCSGGFSGAPRLGFAMSQLYINKSARQPLDQPIK
jgi:hypothetical protein